MRLFWVASSNFLCQGGGRPVLSLLVLFPPEILLPATFPVTGKSPDFLFSFVFPSEQTDLRVSSSSLSSWGAAGGLFVVFFLSSSGRLFRVISSMVAVGGEYERGL